MNALSAYDGITLEHGGCTVLLRPSLRAALHLERLHEGFPGLLRKVEEFDTRTVRAMILVGGDRQAAERFLCRAAALPLSGFKEAAQAPLYALVAAMLPQHDETKAKPSTTGKPTPWCKVYLKLLQMATGWLGWPPETAWSATPQEITDAFEAHVAKLKAIHGTADEEEATSSGTTFEQRERNVELGLDPDFDRAGLHALKGMGKL